MGLFDYSGASRIPLLLQWQNLSQTLTGTTVALKMVWTDIAANSVLGTRSLTASATKGDSANQQRTSMPDIAVIFFANSIRFHMLYEIPAFLTLAMTLLVCTFVLASIFLHGSGPRRMTRFLNWTSTGRIFTSLNQGSDKSVIYLSPKPPKAWIKEEGKRDLTVMDQGEGETGQTPEQESDTTEPTYEEDSDTPPAQQRLPRVETAP